MTKRILTAGAVAAVFVLCVATTAQVAGQDASSSAATPSSSSAAASASTASASDADLLAHGKQVWSDAACSNCHGQNAGGGHSADFPAGPNLRTSGLDPQSMLQIVECGIPDTKMPSWLKGAYTETACYGNPLGPAPSGIVASGAYTEDELKALIDYVQTNFMKQPMPTWSNQ